jgi:hypothetical protein
LLHSLSVAITLCHIVITAYVLSRIGKSMSFACATCSRGRSRATSAPVCQDG